MTAEGKQEVQEEPVLTIKQVCYILAVQPKKFWRLYRLIRQRRRPVASVSINAFPLNSLLQYLSGRKRYLLERNDTLTRLKEIVSGLPLTDDQARNPLIGLQPPLPSVVYVKVTKAARQLGVRRQRLTGWIVMGRLTAKQTKNSWLIPEDELRRFANELRQGSFKEEMTAEDVYHAVATACEVTRCAVINWVRAGLLQNSRAGSLYVLDWSAVREFLERTGRTFALVPLLRNIGPSADSSPEDPRPQDPA
jgi:hypothetical protein